MLPSQQWFKKKRQESIVNDTWEIVGRAVISDGRERPMRVPRLSAMVA
jgi:hypothetical protein